MMKDLVRKYYALCSNREPLGAHRVDEEFSVDVNDKEVLHDAIRRKDVSHDLNYMN